MLVAVIARPPERLHELDERGHPRSYLEVTFPRVVGYRFDVGHLVEVGRSVAEIGSPCWRKRDAFRWGR